MYKLTDNSDQFPHSLITRYTWFVLIILFICLCFYQIGAQAVMYWLTPVATNIIAAYPDSLAFPVIAVCNNNQHRLSWLTGESVQERRPRNPPPARSWKSACAASPNAWKT